jgi:hypothetical protein
MGGIFSSPKAPAQSPAIEAGISTREKQAQEAEDREKKRIAARRRRMLGGMGIGSGVLPEELPAPATGGTKLGVDRNPGT